MDEVTTQQTQAEAPGGTFAPNGANRLERHRYSTIYPDMPPDELKELAADIKAHGLIDDIITLDGQILDGWHRYLACQMAGVEPRFIEYSGYLSLHRLAPSTDPLMFVASRNSRRRHLTKNQVKTLGLNFREAAAEDAVARKLGGIKVPPERSGKSVEVAVKSLSASGAELSARTLDRLHEIELNAPDLAERAKRDEITWDEASDNYQVRKGNIAWDIRARVKSKEITWAQAFAEDEERRKQQPTPPAPTNGKHDQPTPPPPAEDKNQEEEVAAYRTIITDEARLFAEQPGVLWCGEVGSVQTRTEGQKIEMKAKITALCAKGLVAQLADWTVDTCRKPGKRVRVADVLWEVTKSELAAALEKWNGGQA